jgi:putative ABC transport system permease protein
MFFSKQKMKEIGIRKVLGFSVGNIYIKLVSEFVWLSIISIVVAPPSVLIIYRYLPGAYKYSIQIWEFLIATGIILFVALITISYHIIESVRTNPVEILRYE